MGWDLRHVWRKCSVARAVKPRSAQRRAEGAGLERHLQGYGGIPQTDAYAGFNRFYVRAPADAEQLLNEPASGNGGGAAEVKAPV